MQETTDRWIQSSKTLAFKYSLLDSETNKNALFWIIICFFYKQKFNNIAFIQKKKKVQQLISRCLLHWTVCSLFMCSGSFHFFSKLHIYCAINQTVHMLGYKKERKKVHTRLANLEQAEQKASFQLFSLVESGATRGLVTRPTTE